MHSTAKGSRTQFCQNGHPRTPENTYDQKGRTVGGCKICGRERDKARRQPGFKRQYTHTHCKQGHERTPENRASNGQCRPCKLEKIKEWWASRPLYKQTWRSNMRRSNWHGVNLEHIKTRYGLTLSEYEEMMYRQKGNCAACKRTLDVSKPKTSPHIDHDHVTGKVRGILCRMCNIGIGHFDDDTEAMLAAVSYLKKHKNPDVPVPTIPVATLFSQEIAC